MGGVRRRGEGCERGGEGFEESTGKMWREEGRGVERMQRQ